LPFHISRLDILVIVVYLLAALGLGLYQAVKIRTSGDYYAGGRKFNKFYLMMHALGTASHADEPVSVIGGAYEKGLSGIWYTYLYLPLTPIFWLLAPYIRRTRFVTMADFFRMRYDQSLAHLYSIVGVLKMAVAISVVLKGTEQIFSALTGNAINPKWAILAMTLIFVTYGFAGGLRATIMTEAIQGPLIVVMSLLFLPFGLHAVGGFAALHRSLDGSKFLLTATGKEFTPQWIAAATITALLGWVAQPGIIAAVGSGKSELEGRVGYTYGTMIKRFCAMGWVFTGIVLAAMVAQGKIAKEHASVLADPKKRELAFGIAMQYLLPAGFLGVMFAAIFSAQMATLSAQMVNSSALAARNIYKAILRPDANDQQILIVGRISGVFLVIIGVLLAFQLQRVATALTMLLGFQSIVGLIVWAGVISRRANSTGAWSSFVVMFLCWAMLGPIGMILNRTGMFPHWVGQYGNESDLTALMLWAVPSGAVAMILGSLLSARPPRKQSDDFFMLLKTPVGQEQKLIDAGVPIIYVGSTEANALETKHPRLVHWGGFALAAVICALILGLLKVLSVIGS